MAAREHRHGVDERPRRRLLQQVAEDHDQRALGALDGLEGELVVGVDGPRLEVEQRAHDGVAARAPRGQPAADAVVEGDDAAAVADHVGHERDGDRGVDGRVEPGAVLQRRAHQAPGVDQQHHLAVLLDAELVAHRPPEPVGRAPVDLPHVVVGRVVADRLEVGAEPERPARQPALLAEAALAHREREPARGGEVGIDEHLVLLAVLVVPAAEPQRTLGAGRDGAERVAAAAQRRQRARRAVPSASRGSSARSGGIGCRSRTRPGPAGVASTLSGAATPRARIGATRRSIRGRARTASASASVAPASASAAISADGRADHDGRERDHARAARGARAGWGSPGHGHVAERGAARRRPGRSARARPRA